LNDVELRLIGELMKNSRRTDRDLAKALDVSKPTVSRAIKRLEREGVIREYAMIPDFSKLGYELMSISFVKMKEQIDDKQAEEIRQRMRKELANSAYVDLTVERGFGLGYDAVFVSLHRNYSEYSQRLNHVKEMGFMNMGSIETFMINLKDEVNYRPLTLKALANKISKTKETSR
jgi:DNA-binding Lrp family transcriptional regulator